MTSHTLFISDLHLEPDQPTITNNFLKFLAQYAPQADAIYILGDFFEVWVGDDNHSVFNDMIQQALKKLTDTGIPVYLMRGNRDFLIGKQFANKTGLHLLPDPSIINLYGTPSLLMHGDSLCTHDIKHLRFRKYAHNPRYNRYFLWLPLFLRLMLARSIRKASRKHTRTIPYSLMDVTESEVERMLQLHNTALLIHGHTHKPAIHSLSNTAATRIVLGAWHEQGNMLIYYADGSYKLQNF